MTLALLIEDLVERVQCRYAGGARPLPFLTACASSPLAAPPVAADEALRGELHDAFRHVRVALDGVDGVCVGVHASLEFLRSALLDVPSLVDGWGGAAADAAAMPAASKLLIV